MLRFAFHEPVPVGGNSLPKINGFIVHGQFAAAAGYGENRMAKSEILLRNRIDSFNRRRNTLRFHFYRLSIISSS